MKLALDHLVVGARTLAEGVAWCVATLGVTPGPGGEHPLMGTHNRLLRLDDNAFPRAYFEIIAIDPAAPAPGRDRWFDLDRPALQRRLARGPALIHWVARCGSLDAACAAWRAEGLDRGEALAAERDTPDGLLRWRISVRRDGQRLHDGALPTLIEWGERHPVDRMAASPLRLESLQLRGVPESLQAQLPDGVRTTAHLGAPALSARLSTPLGIVELHSPD
jgi:hypothetical protein